MTTKELIFACMDTVVTLVKMAGIWVSVKLGILFDFMNAVPLAVKIIGTIFSVIGLLYAWNKKRWYI
jgi:hypothetical protein